jgi:hypothetical protein
MVVKKLQRKDPSINTMLILIINSLGTESSLSLG